MCSNKSSLLALVFVLLVGWMSSASGFGTLLNIMEASAQYTADTYPVTSGGLNERLELVEKRLKTNRMQQILKQPGAIDHFNSEIATGECGPVVDALAEASVTEKNEFCSSMLANADVFLADDADHTPAGITASIIDVLSGNLDEDEPSPEVPPDDLDNRPLDEFGDVEVPPEEPDMPLPEDEPPVPDDGFDCQTGDPSDDWYSDHC